MADSETPIVNITTLIPGLEIQLAVYLISDSAEKTLRLELGPLQRLPASFFDATDTSNTIFDFLSAVGLPFEQLVQAMGGATDIRLMSVEEMGQYRAEMAKQQRAAELQAELDAQKANQNGKILLPN